MEMRLSWSAVSALRWLSGALLFQERHYSCSALIQTVPAAQVGVGKVPGLFCFIFNIFFFKALIAAGGISLPQFTNQQHPLVMCGQPKGDL